MADHIQKKHVAPQAPFLAKKNHVTMRAHEEYYVEGQLQKSHNAIEDIIKEHKKTSPYEQVKADIHAALMDHPKFITLYKKLKKQPKHNTSTIDIIWAIVREIETVLAHSYGIDEENFHSIVDIFNNPEIPYYYDILIYYITITCARYEEAYLIPPYIWNIVEKNGLATIPASIGITTLEDAINRNTTKHSIAKSDLQKHFLAFEIEISTLIRQHFTDLEEYEHEMFQEKIWHILPKNIQEYLTQRPDKNTLLEIMYAVHCMSNTVKDFIETYIQDLHPVLHHRALIDCDYSALIINQYLQRASIPKLNTIFIPGHASLIIPGTQIVLDTYDFTFRLIPEFLMTHSATRQEIQTYIELNEQKSLNEETLDKRVQLFIQNPEHLQQFYYIRDASNLPAEVISGFGFLYEKHLDDNSKAIAFHEAAIAVDPHNYYAHFNKGVFYENRQKGFYSPYAAEVQYMKCLRINPFNAQAYYTLGNLYRDHDNYEKAMQAYHSALNINNRYPEVLNEIGNLHKRNGHYQEALQCYTKAYMCNPKLEVALVNLVEYYEHFYDKVALNKYALELAEISSNPYILDTLYRILTKESPESHATFYVGLDRLDRTFEAYKIAPTSAHKDHLLHSIQELFRDYEDSSLLREHNHIADRLKIIGRTLLNTQQWSSAIEVLEMAGKYLPEDPYIIGDLGTCHSFLHNYHKALEYYLTVDALLGNAKDPTILTNIGCTYADLKDYKRAKIYIHQALAINPHFQGAIDSLGNINNKEKNL